MAQLTYTIEDINLEGHPTATVVALKGSVDPETIETFDNIFDELIDAGRKRIAIDLGSLKYINSTGMGILVQYVDQLEEDGGGMVLMNIHPKILIVLEMLGLQELFRIVATPEEAVDALAGKEVTPAEVQVKLEEKPAAKPAGKPAPAPMASAPATAPVPASAKPRLVRCGCCGAMLSTPMAGTYRCPRCRAALKVDTEGKVETYAINAEGVVELALPPQSPFIDSIDMLVGAACVKAGFSDAETDGMIQSSLGCAATLSKYCLHNDAKQGQLHILLRTGEKDVRVRMYCAGKALSGTEALDAHRRNVGGLTYEASSTGNLLTLEKTRG